MTECYKKLTIVKETGGERNYKIRKYDMIIRDKKLKFVAETRGEGNGIFVSVIAV